MCPYCTVDKILTYSIASTVESKYMKESLYIIYYKKNLGFSQIVITHIHTLKDNITVECPSNLSPDHKAQKQSMVLKHKL